MNNKLTVLAGNDELTIVLVEPDVEGMPKSVVVHWPATKTVSDLAKFPEYAGATVKLFAAATTKLARLKARKRL